MEQTKDLKRRAESIVWYETDMMNSDFSLKSTGIPKNDAEELANYLKGVNSKLGVSTIQIAGTDYHQVTIKDETGFKETFSNAQVKQQPDNKRRHRENWKEISKGKDGWAM